MLSLQLIREQPGLVRGGLARRGADDVPLDDIIALDEEHRALLTEVETIRAERNALSKEIGDLSRQMKTEETKEAKHAEHRRSDLVARSTFLGEKVDGLEDKLRASEERLTELLLQVPNLPADDALDGADESANQVVRTVGEPVAPTFHKPHWELGESLGIIDFERGAKLSGSRFYVLTGPGARLQRALIAFMLDLHLRDGRYREVYPPAMVKGENMLASGQLPKFADNLYRDAEEDLWFVPTAEVPLTSMYRDEILEADSLPLNLVACTPCFRREKMSAGRDVRGIKRGHQFDKVEMYRFVEPERSAEALQELVRDAESVAEALGIPHRVVRLCTGDLGFSAADAYDIELWAPGCGEWLEVSSCSNCTDFQARRANIRFRREPKGRPEHPHTLNGSGLALPRTLIAVLENYQREDGSIVVPDALRPYMGGVDRIAAD
ncbi:MAG: serine--tRNA ligase [Dehalococcoidia bacterium]